MIASFFVDECCDAKTMEKLLIKSAAVFFECGLTEFLVTCDGKNDVIIAKFLQKAKRVYPLIKVVLYPLEGDKYDESLYDEVITLPLEGVFSSYAKILRNEYMAKESSTAFCYFIRNGSPTNAFRAYAMAKAMKKSAVDMIDIYGEWNI